VRVYIVPQHGRAAEPFALAPRCGELVARALTNDLALKLRDIADVVFLKPFIVDRIFFFALAPFAGVNLAHAFHFFAVAGDDKFPRLCVGP
jgi:hypothetical protein